MTKTADVVARIRKSRDDALSVLEVATIKVEDEIAATVQPGLYLTRLAARENALINEAAAISRAATDAVLALPEVIRTASSLKKTSDKLVNVAKDLPHATDILKVTASILSLGQQFIDLIANIQKNK